MLSIGCYISLYGIDNRNETEHQIKVTSRILINNSEKDKN